MYEENAATEMAPDTQTGDGGNGTIDGDGTDTTAGGLFPDTPAPERPVPTPQAHRARISGVTAETNADKGTRYLKISWTSLDTAMEDNLAIFPPQAFTDNVLVDPSTLNTQPNVFTNPDGTTFEGDSDRVKFAKTVRNSKGNGTIEAIVKIAREQGHSVTASRTPQTFDQFATYLNELLTGTECVALLRAQGGDGEFSDRLRTRGFVSQEYADNPKTLKNYRRIYAE